MTRILFVCHANICRSPMAEVVLRDLALKASYTDWVIDSAGTHAQPGKPAFTHTLNVLTQFGHTQPPSLSRPLEYNDLRTFDYVLAMDRRNLGFILRYAQGSTAHIGLLLDEALAQRLTPHDEVSDPFPDGDYEATYRTIHSGCVALMSVLT